VAYNAQVTSASTDAVGLGAVRVGTVDKFQGQEDRSSWCR
jgi:superfamily I DNA and/or RNA helicase